jgi:hypothetical protein
LNNLPDRPPRFAAAVVAFFVTGERIGKALGTQRAIGN